MKKFIFVILFCIFVFQIAQAGGKKKNELILIKGPHPIVDVDNLNKKFFRLSGNSATGTGYSYVPLINLESPTEQKIIKLINASKALNPEIKNWDIIPTGHLVLWKTKGLFEDDFYTVFKKGQTATEIAKKILTSPINTEY